MRTTLYVVTHSAQVSADMDCLVPIQVGKSLNEKRICEVTDDSGDNISAKNRTYCELTALFWMWKNDTTSENLGLLHYRRHLDYDYTETDSILGQYDVIAKKLRYFGESLDEQYRRLHNADDWETLLEVLSQHYPDYYETSRQVFAGNAARFNNMMVCRRTFLDAYCTWLFDILGKVEERKAEKGTEHGPRYLGYLGERLLTLYLIHNQCRVFEAHVVHVKEFTRNKKEELFRRLNFPLLFEARNYCSRAAFMIRRKFAG